MQARSLLLGACLSFFALSGGRVSAAEGIDFGPFTLTGFAKAEWVRASDVCPGNRCQRDPLASKDFVWADELVPGSTDGPATSHIPLLRPHPGPQFDIGRRVHSSWTLRQ